MPVYSVVTAGYLGDFEAGDDVRFKINTLVDGIPTTPTSIGVSVYRSDSTIEDTGAVVTYTDFDSVTGMHHVVVITNSDPSFYQAGVEYQVVAFDLEVSGQSLDGAVIAHFSLENRGGGGGAGGGSDAWDELTADHTATGTFGEFIQSLATLQQLIDGVLDETIADHQDAGSVGEAIYNGGTGGTAPTAAEIAEATLLFDWTTFHTIAPDRCLLQAARFLRNAWLVTGGNLHVKMEDDTNDAWTAPVTTAPGDPTIGVG